MDIPFFSLKDSERIADDVRHGEAMRRRGESIADIMDNQKVKFFWIKLTEKDPDDNFGFWKATEIRWEDREPVEWDEGAQFDDDDYPYIRHKDWDDAQLGDIVKAYQAFDSGTDEEVLQWVFDGAPTNPESFIFYGDGNGGQGQIQNIDGAQWNMPRAGEVLTNVGNAILANDFTLLAGQTAYVTIEFVNSDGWSIAAASMNTEGGGYWEESDDYITVNFPIAEAEIKGDVCRLKQFHAGDIHLEIFSETTVSGGDVWTSVLKAGSDYSVYHDLPADEANKQDEFIGFVPPCENIPTDSFESFISWFTENAVVLRYDTRGHIYEREACSGGRIDNYDPEEPDLSLSGNLQASLVASQLFPLGSEADGFTATYTVQSAGANFLDFINNNSSLLILENDLNQVIETFSVDEPLVKKAARIDSMENVNGTSGNTYTELNPANKNFRFNSTVTVKASTLGQGLNDSVVLNTAAATATIVTISDTIRDYEDDANTPNSMSITYDVTLTTWKARVGFYYGDGTPVRYRFSFNGGFKTGDTDFNISFSASETFTPEFDIREGANHGDVVQMRVTTLSSDLTDANISATKSLYIAQEGTCFEDDQGEHLTDEGDECLENDQVPYVAGDTYHIRMITRAGTFVNTNGSYTMASDVQQDFNNVTAAGSFSQSGGSGVIEFLLDGTGPSAVAPAHFIDVRSGDLFAGAENSPASLTQEITTQTYILGQYTDGTPVGGSFIQTDIYIRRASQGESPW